MPERSPGLALCRTGLSHCIIINEYSHCWTYNERMKSQKMDRPRTTPKELVQWCLGTEMIEFQQWQPSSTWWGTTPTTGVFALWRPSTSFTVERLEAILSQTVPSVEANYRHLWNSPLYWCYDEVWFWWNPNGAQWAATAAWESFDVTIIHYLPSFCWWLRVASLKWSHWNDGIKAKTLAASQKVDLI